MCELFALSSLFPSRVTISLHELARHGGGDGPHRDGWGIAYFDEGDALVLKEAAPACKSPWVRLIEGQDIRSTIVMSHIRQATLGERKLRNTQPFVREVAGRMHVFAHNGHLEGLEGDVVPGSRFRPVGDTDSERAFCLLLAGIEDLWSSRDDPPPVRARFERVLEFAASMRPHGAINFVYSDGDTVFVHGDRRRREGEVDGTLPGLYALWRNFVTEASPLVARGLQIASDTREDRSVLVASVPLTREAWIPLRPGELLALQGGRLVASARSAAVAVA